MILIDILPDPITKRQIVEGEISLTHALMLDAQLDMYKYFEQQLEKSGGYLTLDYYLEDVKPYVEMMREAVNIRLAEAKPDLIRLGLLQED